MENSNNNNNLPININNTSSLMNSLTQAIEAIPDFKKEDKQFVLETLSKLKKQTINILLAGPTGVGKSSTVNALFRMDKAKVGDLAPETMEIEKYELDNLILWDSPGLGDSPEKDESHARKILAKLNETDANGHAVIDLVLFLIDASSRDMGTSFELLNKVIIPNMVETNRIVIALNQCDLAMKGKGWDEVSNKPSHELETVLDEKAVSVKRRIYESTQVDVDPIYYSAGQRYNLSKLLTYLIRVTPEEKRMTYVDNLNTDVAIWHSNDGRENYFSEIKESFKFSLSRFLQNAAAGAAAGSKIGRFIPIIGPVFGGILGGILGGFLGDSFSDE